MGIPIGIITAWYDTIENIPEKWSLCNGENGTPDLRGYFVLHAGGDTGIGQTGGSNSTHTHPTPSLSSGGGNHTHSATVGTGSADSGVGLDSAGTSSAASKSHSHNDASVELGNGNNAHTHTVSGVSGAAYVIPPYRKLFYIMKTS